MPSRSFMILLLLSFVIPHAYSDELQQTLQTLDKVIEQKEVYRQNRQNRIDSLSVLWAQRDLTEAARIDVASEMHRLYSRYRSDTAIYCLDYILSTDSVRRTPWLHDLYSVYRAENLAVTGSVIKALQIMDSIHVDESTRYELRDRYYQTMRTIYGYLTDYHEGEPIAQQYAATTQLYRDSVLMIEKNPVSLAIARGDNFIQHGDAVGAEVSVAPYADDPDPQVRAYCEVILYDAFRLRGDKKQQQLHLARAAIHDLQSGQTEYCALSRLAELVFEDEDVARARRYLNCALEDATLGHAALRSQEVMRLLPMVQEMHLHTLERVHLLDQILIVVVLISLLLLGYFAYSLSKEKRRLLSAQQSLAEANHQLSVSNRQLSEMDRMKEQYIIDFVMRCNYYLDLFDNFRKRCLTLAKSRKNEELLNMLMDETSFHGEEDAFLEHFDTAMLCIHPDFVTKFNALLRPGEQIVLKKDEKLNTELRIFALIRLGVDDPKQIAQFLGYTTTTIYTYSSRVRSRSDLPKEEFDARVMKI